jgi:hypothetical protein
MTVIDWLLDGDPAIRWQVMRDLLDAPPDEVAAERARVAREGWGARLLALQDPDGHWDGGTYRPGWADNDRPFYDAWTATHFTLQTLRDCGVDPADPSVRQAIELVRGGVEWAEEDGGRPYFSGTEEPCMTGVLLGISVYFGQDPTATLGMLLDSQLSDGGWNCQHSPVGSFHSTICAVEGLLAWEQSADLGDPLREAARAARLRGEEYLLERRLLWRRSTRELVDPRFTLLSYPVRWYYDVLRALEHFRLARPEGDPRMTEAVELVRAKPDPEGRWWLENKHKGPTPFYMDREREGEPSRWVTLRALRVLRWADGLPH